MESSGRGGRPRDKACPQTSDALPPPPHIHSAVEETSPLFPVLWKLMFPANIEDSHSNSLDFHQSYPHSNSSLTNFPPSLPAPLPLLSIHLPPPPLLPIHLPPPSPLPIHIPPQPLRHIHVFPRSPTRINDPPSPVTPNIAIPPQETHNIAIPRHYQSLPQTYPATFLSPFTPSEATNQTKSNDNFPVLEMPSYDSPLPFNPLSEEMKETFTELNKAIQNCKYYNEEEFVSTRKNSDKDLSFLSMNINGFQNKQ